MISCLVQNAAANISKSGKVRYCLMEHKAALGSIMISRLHPSKMEHQVYHFNYSSGNISHISTGQSTEELGKYMVSCNL